MDINSLMPTDNYKKQRAESLGLVNKWEKTGLLEGLDRDHEKTNMAVLLENQAKQLVQEASSTGGSGQEEWSGVALPLVRRVFAEIAAKDFVSVQAMNLPSGLVFFLDFKYGTGQPGFTTAGGAKSQNNSLFGVTDATKGTTTATEGLYGAGRFGYSINEATSSVIFASTQSLTPSATSASMVAANATTDINFDSELSASQVATKGTYTGLYVLTVASASLTQGGGMDTKGVRAFVPSNSATSTINSVFPKFTTYNSTTGNVSFIVSSSARGNAAADLLVSYQVQPTDSTRGDFEQYAGENQDNNPLDIPQINLTMNSEAIVAKTRKLKAVWTPEFAQDLNAYHSIDAEAELTSMLSEYVSMEIDLEILSMLLESAQTTDYWSANINQVYDAGSTSFRAQSTSGTAYNQGTWFQTLGTKLQKVSNKIHQLTLRGGANFLVCSPTVATILESIPGYAADTDGRKDQFAMGVQKIGTINNQYTVYKNPYMTENTILMGYKGAAFLETGAVYAPYVPLIMTPLIYDPDSFTPRKGVMTRYAKKVVRPEFYGKVYVAGLDSI